VSDGVLTLTDATFAESVSGSRVPLIVDFWAEWCGPCKMLTPVLEEIATEWSGRLAVGKLNVDDNQETARKYEVLSIPTLLIFVDGEIRKRIVGAKGKTHLLHELEEFIA